MHRKGGVSMRKFKCVVLPILLCAALLLGGYYAPELYSRFSNDHIGAVSTVSLADAQNPMYIADGVSFELAPWDRIDRTQTRPYADILAENSTAFNDENRLNQMIEGFVLALNADAATLNTPDYAAELRCLSISIDALGAMDMFFILEDFRFTSVYGTQYDLDLVFGYSGVYYIRLVRADGTQPCNGSVAIQALYSAFPYAARDFEIGLEGSESMPLQTTLSERLYQFFISSYFGGSYFDANREFLYQMISYWNYEGAYTVTYEDLTLLVWPDMQNNPYVLFLDGKNNDICGFSVVPESLYAYAAYDSFPFPSGSPNPIEDN